jgi:acyl-CoA hydrolase
MQPKKSEPVHNWSFVFPNDANPQGTMFGGKLLAIMDIVAGIAASRHSRTHVAIASTDSITFMTPLHVGDMVDVIACVVWTGRTSMVVKTDVFGEEQHTGIRKHCISTYLIMIAIDENHRPTPVPPLLVETENEIKEYAVAEKVKNRTMAQRNMIEQS